MKYADKLIELMGAYPGREFKMSALIRYINPKASRQEKKAIRTGLSRAILELNEVGMIVIVPPKALRGGYALYKWKVLHDVVESDTRSATLRPG